MDNFATFSVSPAKFVIDIQYRPTLEASTRDCGILILTLLEPGNDVMAARGFDIKEDMPDGVTLNIPPFLNGCTQLSLLMMKIKQENCSCKNTC